jgi:hypothetical protein
MRPQNILAIVPKNKFVQWLGQFRIPFIKEKCTPLFSNTLSKKNANTVSHWKLFSLMFFTHKNINFLVVFREAHKSYFAGSVTCPDNRIIPVQLSQVKKTKGLSHINLGFIGNRRGSNHHNIGRCVPSINNVTSNSRHLFY